MNKKSRSLMQSEVFIIIMIIIALLYITTTIYASQLNSENKNLEKENKNLKQNEENNSDLENEIKEKQQQNVSLKQQVADLEKQLGQKEQEYADLKIKYTSEKNEWKKHKKPPLIKLQESKEKFRFDSGEAYLTKKYKDDFLEDKLIELKESINNYECNTIEVYGYTDTQPINTNKDDKLHKCLTDECSIDNIRSASNIELGMKRAISIVNFLRQLQSEGKIGKDIIIKPYSAGQFIDENGKIATRDQQDLMQRRRIEIRLSNAKEKNQNSNNE